MATYIAYSTDIGKFLIERWRIPREIFMNFIEEITPNDPSS